MERLVKDKNLTDSIIRNDSNTAHSIAKQNAADLIEQLKKEQQEIISISCKFARFINKNSILKFNSDLNDYLDLLIREEEGKNAQGADNESILQGLRDTKTNFSSQKEMLELESNADFEICDSYCDDDVDDLLDELFCLPLNGQKLKMSVEALKKYRRL